jgi:hypothetical protein
LFAGREPQKIDHLMHQLQRKIVVAAPNNQAHPKGTI